MKDDETRKLVQKSLITTSEDFTDRLLRSIEAEEAKPALFPWPARLILLCSAGALLLGSTFVYLIAHTTPGLLQPPVLAFAGFVILWLIYYVLQLRENYRQLV
ncbi:hypothetical protein [Flavilitoribacter nigricans]|uniref:Uncharacterized protein n=1 Tax=Flavilitoribacter nigricans (strain ATCC 23147 / DSM 23189 / NBRC 102662 / NCIMB 1420 / SS-2) TaxID=1122177 RepID=A0A2D0N4R0_FLAN2|nr:hypothetical protein [Flavilitoribacter nigricans]PHN03484.1 hypothetical protein CRP01_26130 [Flavilitoribacter nigricans DSM 23189 = NBRC 102662]